MTNRSPFSALAAAAAFVWALVPGVPALAYPTNVAFRGGTIDAPENTLATYDATLNNGGEWLEFDVWVSADGVPVCHHDETLERTTNGSGIIWQKTLAYLKTLDAGSWFDPQFAGEEIPTLEQALTLVEGRGKVLLDIKSNDYIDEIAQAIANVGFPQEDVFGWIRFGTGMMTNYKNQLPASEGLLSTKYLMDADERFIWERTQADDRPDLGLINAVKHLDGHPEWVELAHSYGLVVFEAGVLSSGFQDAFDLGVDGLIVAHPAALAALLPLADPECSDGLDNDGDGLVDAAEEPGCFGPEDHAEAAVCSDGLDNDGDGDTDYPADAGCFAAFYDFEEPECSDGVDNNGDGEVDYPADLGCFAAFDQREGLACNDGQDNDEDGLSDYPADPGCDGPTDPNECGATDCDGPCGDCGPGLTCNPTGSCVCAPVCDGKECGDDACGGSCGTCGPGQLCDGAGSCVCAPDCTGRTCGDDGCGGSCGSCDPGQLCDGTGACVCAPDCTDKECGDDGCGGSCGACGPHQACDGGGLCICVPDCAEKLCGDDGCGGSCGVCDGPLTCDLLLFSCCAPDADGDSVCDPTDCAPLDAEAFAPPPEISQVAMPAASTLSWQSLTTVAGAGTTYEVLRGLVAELPVGGAAEACVLSGSTTAGVTDPWEPASGGVFYYLVRGRNVCDVGTYGYDSAAVERVSGACP